MGTEVNKFKPGDRVVCIDSEETAALCVGVVYTVQEAEDGFVRFAHSPHWWLERRFRPADISPAAEHMRRTDTTKPTNPKQALGIAKAPLSTLSAQVLAEVGVAQMEGALKYGRHNWRVAGVRASVYYDAAQRHLMAWWEGEDTDPDSGLSHVTKAIAGLIVLRDAMLQKRWVDDRPPQVTQQGWVGELNEKAAALLEKYPEPEKPWTQMRVESKETC